MLSSGLELAYEVVRHVDVRDSAAMACACSALRNMQQSELWWRRATERLGVEAKLYVSQTEAGEPIEGGTWRDYFFRLWESRDRWQEPEGDAVEQARERFRKLTAGETVETPQVRAVCLSPGGGGCWGF